MDAKTLDLIMDEEEDEVDIQIMMSAPPPTTSTGPSRADRRPPSQGIFQRLDGYSPELFYSSFRMSRDCCDQLLSVLMESAQAEELYPQPGLPFRRKETLPPLQRLLIGLWFLATQDSYRSIASNFDVTISSIFEAVNHTLMLVAELEERYVQWPSLEEMALDEATFFNRYGFPGVIGCVDGTHIEMSRPTKHGDTYFNRKKDYSLNVMVTVDSSEKIVHCSVGYPGSYHDARVLRKSTLVPKLEELPGKYHLLGDSAYRLESYLIKPFPTTQQRLPRVRNFNLTHSATRVVVENAIGRLKGKWCRLKRVNSSSPKRVRLITRVCVVLHNFVITHDSVVDKAGAVRRVRLPTAANGIQKRDTICRLLR